MSFSLEIFLPVSKKKRETFFPVHFSRFSFISLSFSHINTHFIASNRGKRSSEYATNLHSAGESPVNQPLFPSKYDIRPPEERKTVQFWLCLMTSWPWEVWPWKWVTWPGNLTVPWPWKTWKCVLTLKRDFVLTWHKCETRESQSEHCFSFLAITLTHPWLKNRKNGAYCVASTPFHE